jgi:antitoxin (DNA-binding transcriptional repressor) of toxin-antitoxin stability system
MTEVVKIHQAKTHLSRWIEQAVNGLGFVIAKAGKPMVRVLALAPAPATRELGFLAGQGVITADLKRDFVADIDAMFASPQ